jgi:hypothetical protein
MKIQRILFHAATTVVLSLIALSAAAQNIPSRRKASGSRVTGRRNVMC